jgi:hypothetical protein
MNRDRRIFVVGLIATLLVAVVVAQFASSEPDGLEYVAEQEGFAETAAEHDLSGAPLADYGEELTSSSWVNTAVAGVVGVLLTLAIGYGLFWLTRRMNRNRPESASP